ncbi:MAG: ribosomal protein S18-alanine N-acetyltransferase [Chloroflexota bacterium]
MALTAPVVIAPMTLEDVDAAHEIERLSFATPWPAYAFEQELRGNRLARYLVARAGDEFVGFAGMWMMVDDAHITTISVHPEWRRRGVGRQLLLDLTELAISVGARRMTLEVRAGNAGAHSLYREFGFDVVGRRPGYYSDDGEDALVMTTPDLETPAMRTVLEWQRRRRPA